jgi:predicted kinase
MIKKTKKFLLIVDGPMGVGKTTVSKIIHEKINNTALLGLDKVKWLVSGFKRTVKQNEMTRSVVKAMTVEYLSHGVNVIIDQGMRKEAVKQYKELAKEHKAKFILFELEAPHQVLMHRLAGRPVTPGRSKVSKSRINRNYKAYLANKGKGYFTVNAVDKSPQQIAKLILKEIRG